MEIVQLIGTYGFPVVACIAMGWYVKYMIDQYRSDISRINEEHKKEMDSITEALNNNTMVLTRLCTMIEKKNGKVELDD